MMVDEMSLGLAPAVVEQLMGALDTIRDEGVTVLLVEQDVQLARSRGPTGAKYSRPDASCTAA